MTETSKLTNHAVQRARERLGLGAAECELVINTLWNRGRVPTPDDWRAFETVPMPGYAYRVTAFRARRVLIVQEVRGFTFVTLRIARTKQRRIL